MAENDAYYKGISKSTADKKKSQMVDQANMDDDDAGLYDRIGEFSDFIIEGKLTEAISFSPSMNKRKNIPNGDIEVNLNGDKYTFAYSADAMGTEPYGIILPGKDVITMFGKDKTAKKLYSTIGSQLRKWRKDNYSNLIESVVVEGKFKNESVNESVSDKEVFAYLRDLRDSGKTNMFGAAAYIERDFGLDKRKAKELLAKWMKSFNEGKLTEAAGTWGKADADLAKEARAAGFNPKKK